MAKEYYIPANVEVIFVADLFAEDYLGGAELTTEAILSSTDKKVFKLHSESLTEELVKRNRDKYWVLTNWTRVPTEGLISLVTESCNFSIIEYDYKYCKWRSSHLHKLSTGEECDCHSTKNGKFVSQFYGKSDNLFFMSLRQQEEYTTHFPRLLPISRVLSSVWRQEDLDKLERIKGERSPADKWAILKGGSWIKAQQQTEAYAQRNYIDYELIGGLPYDDFILELSRYKGLIFHPAGFDTCPRLVVEAKLMGLELDLNENVQHKNEEWFLNDELLLPYLKTAPTRFWGALEKYIKNK